jgi:hypothetical protein
MKLETVAIADGFGGYVVINRSDYDPAIHSLWAAADDPTPPEPPPPPVERVSTGAIARRATSLMDLKTVPELKEMAKAFGVSGYSKLKQAELATAIATAEADRGELPTTETD